MSTSELSEVLDELERLNDLAPGTVSGSISIEIDVDLDTDNASKERSTDVTTEAPQPSDVADGLEPAITPREDNAGEPKRDSEGYLDHDDPEHLEWAFEKFDTISRAADEFDASYPTVRARMIDYGVYEPDSYRQESDDASDQEIPRLEWLARPAEEIVDESPAQRELSEILDIHQRLAMTSLNSTRGLLWELGFVKPNKTQFVDDEILDERISKLREVAVE